jgi:hypothetical protein
MASQNAVRILGLVVCLHLAACGGERFQPYPQCPRVNPSEGLYARLRNPSGEYYHAVITNPVGIEQAIALWQGRSQGLIAAGRMVCQRVDWNCPWSWHLDPESVGFPEVVIEACMSPPSWAETHCASFLDIGYCPDGELIELRDCRTNPDCPMMPR